MVMCDNEKCSYNNDRVCSLKKKHCAWRTRSNRRFASYLDMAMHKGETWKDHDRNPSGSVC